VLAPDQVDCGVLGVEAFRGARGAFSPQFAFDCLPERLVVIRDVLTNCQQRVRLRRIHAAADIDFVGRNREVKARAALLTNGITPHGGRDVGLIRCLVPGEARIPVNPIDAFLGLTDVCGGEPQHLGVNCAHQFKHRPADLGLVNLLPRREPFAIVVLFQIPKKGQALRREAFKPCANCHIPIIRPMVHAAEAVREETSQHLSDLSRVTVLRNVPLAGYTRFGIGGPADIFIETDDTNSFIQAFRIARDSGLETVVIGGGSNLVVSDEGFRGVVLKLSNRKMRAEGNSVYVEGGAVLQSLVDFTVDLGLKGLETMTGIPGFVGAAIYGNAGAYGHSIQERVKEVRFFDGAAARTFDNAQCEFHYRESTFKKHKEWIIFSADLAMEPGDAAELRATADKILATRNRKYPPTMKCAGSIFKNYLLAELPASAAAEVPAGVVIEGKVPSAWFLEQIGAKGMCAGDIHVADYHANLIYNAGSGTARELTGIIRELKKRVEDRWGMPLEEEVQYVGFSDVHCLCSSETL
jgi:UDP-N-acetylmuramate dehydrogenase